jgi:RNA 2',3'-cyclic 3'-phosphodiesterase
VRLFAAADLPDGVREELAAWGASCARIVPGLRPVPAERMHLTLVFLGSRPDAEAQEIGDLVTACADGPVEVRLGDALWLAPRRPHVLTIALTDATGRLGELQARVAGALEAGIGHALEPRPYLPHVTVARVRRGAKVRPGDVALPRVPRARLPLTSLTLYRSHPGPAPRYEALARAVLEERTSRRRQASI